MKSGKSLTDEEKRVVKALLADGKRNQDIHALINHERPNTINFGRIAGVKSNANIQPATPEEVATLAAESEAHIVGISSLAAGHLALVPALPPHALRKTSGVGCSTLELKCERNLRIDGNDSDPFGIESIVGS